MDFRDGGGHLQIKMCYFLRYKHRDTIVNTGNFTLT